MARPNYDIGIRRLDEILDGGVHPGTVISLLGKPGSGRVDIALRFLSRGLDKGEIGLFVSFPSIPLAGHLKGRDPEGPLRSLFHADDPIFLETNDLSGLEILLEIIDEGEIRRMVLDRPEVLERRGEADWFRGLENVLASARKMKIGTILIANERFNEMCDLISEGIIAASRDDEGRLLVNAVKWPFQGGGSAGESRAGEWIQ